MYKCLNQTHLKIKLTSQAFVSFGLFFIHSILPEKHIIPKNCPTGTLGCWDKTHNCRPGNILHTLPFFYFMFPPFFFRLHPSQSTK